MNGSSLIAFENVSFAYEAANPVLREVTFRLSAGQRAALIGANGSGKTTLLHLAVGLLRPDAGRIRAFGEERSREADFWEVRARVGLVFQDPGDQLFCPTVLEDVAFGPLNLGQDRRQAVAEARAMLASLDMAGYEDRITYKLSGGEKRLVSLAAVLAMEPEVLLLDEPTAGLDRRFVDRLVEILDTLEASMLAVSHDGYFLRCVADRAVRLRDARLEECPLQETPAPE